MIAPSFEKRLDYNFNNKSYKMTVEQNSASFNQESPAKKFSFEPSSDNIPQLGAKKPVKEEDKHESILEMIQAQERRAKENAQKLSPPVFAAALSNHKESLDYD